MKKITDKKIKNALSRVEKDDLELLKNWLLGLDELSAFITRSGNVNYEDARKHFLLHYPISDFCIYKQNKHSGYNNLLIWKNVLLISCADFMSSQQWECEYQRGDWLVTKTHSLYTALLKNIFGGCIYDNRCSKITPKPSVKALKDRITAMLSGEQK